MDMSNSTAAGPSRGLLDVIFGSNQEPGEAEAGGQEFGGLMELIKTLNGKKDAEGQSADASRTLRETLSGKGIGENNVVGTLDGNNAAFESGERQLALMQELAQREQEERLQRLAMLGAVPAAAAMVQPGAQQPMALQSMKAEQVNQALQAKGLPPLSQQEMKLLQEINGKIAQVKAGEQGVEIPAELAAGAGVDKAVNLAHPKAAIPGDRAVDPALQKAIAAKGIDPKKLKETDSTVTSGAPEKILTTEAYLQMHESANANGKANAKEPGAKANQPANVEASAPQLRVPEALTAGAVAGASQKGTETRKGDGSPEQLSDGATKANKLDAAAGGATFGAALAQKSEIPQHDIFLPGADKPDQMRAVLLGEVGNSVAMHAHKGGGEMRLVLHPDDMGEVKLKVGTKDGKVEVTVVADNEATAKLIRGGTKELESSLKSQNLSLAKFEVSVTDASSVASTDTRSGMSEQFSSQQHQQQQHAGTFAQTNADDSRNSRWANDQGSRQGGGYSSRAEEQGARSARPTTLSAKTPARSMDNSRRLDVVA